MAVTTPKSSFEAKRATHFFSPTVNGTAVATALRSKSATGLSMVSFYCGKYLAAGDIITATSLSSAGNVVLKAGSAVEVLKIA